MSGQSIILTKVLCGKPPGGNLQALSEHSFAKALLELAEGEELW